MPRMVLNAIHALAYLIFIELHKVGAVTHFIDEEIEAQKVPLFTKVKQLISSRSEFYPNSLIPEPFLCMGVYIKIHSTFTEYQALIHAPRIDLRVRQGPTVPQRNFRSSWVRATWSAIHWVYLPLSGRCDIEKASRIVFGCHYSMSPCIPPQFLAGFEQTLVEWTAKADPSSLLFLCYCHSKTQLKMWHKAKNYIHLSLPHILHSFIHSKIIYWLPTISEPPILTWDTVVNMSDKDPALLQAVFEWMKQSIKTQKPTNQKNPPYFLWYIEIFPLMQPYLIYYIGRKILQILNPKWANFSKCPL